MAVYSSTCRFVCHPPSCPVKTSQVSLTTRERFAFASCKLQLAVWLSEERAVNYTMRRLHLKFSSSPLLTPLWSSTFLFQLKLVVPTEHAISIMQQEEERQIHFKCSNFELDMQRGEILNKFKKTQRVEYVSEYFLKPEN